MIKPIREISDDEEGFRTERKGAFEVIRRKPVQPVPVGSFVMLVFRVEGYDPDCDGSLMARLARVDREGRDTGWEPFAIGLDHETAVQVDAPGDAWEKPEGGTPQ